MPQDDDELRGVLRGEADRHHPDRAAMLERIERGRANRRPSTAAHRMLTRPFEGLHRPGGLVRPAAAALVVAAMLVAGVTGIRLSSSPGQGPQVAAPPPAPSTLSRSVPSTPVPPPSAAHSSTPTRRFSSPPPAKTSPAVRGNYLTSTGRLDSHSFENWSQQQVTLATTEQITALDVTIRIARTDGVADTGHWTSIPAEMVTASVVAEEKALVYRFVLKSGATLGAGSYTFASQFNHAPTPRPLTGDSYAATTTASRETTVRGGFTA